MKAKELLKRIESKSAPVIIDARTGIEFRRGHVPGAINAPPRKILPEDGTLAEGQRPRNCGLLCARPARLDRQETSGRPRLSQSLRSRRLLGGLERIRPAFGKVGGNMAAAGIDMGSRSTKVVILEGDRILAAATLQTADA